MKKVFQFAVFVLAIGVSSLPMSLLEKELVTGGQLQVWCNTVPGGNGCPPPEIQGGGQSAALCAALPVTKPGAVWPGQLYTHVQEDNCSNYEVADIAVCGIQQLVSGDDCLEHRAWLPF